MGDKMDFAGKNPFTDSPKIQNNFNDDFGRESLGIIAPNQLDFGRESSFLYDDFARESLGIINPNYPGFGRESLGFLHDDFGRESLGIVNLDSLDIGRESLGITNIRTHDFVVSNVNLPQIYTSNSPLETTKTSDTSLNSILNNAFLNIPKCSISSSISSRNPSFNSASLESFPSRIFSSTSSKTDILNNAFGDTSQFVKGLELFNSSPSKTHQRINSLPVTLESKIDCENGKGACKSEELTEHVSLSNGDENDDSVFLEKILMSYKNADSSTAGLGDIEDNMLDSTQEPEEMANILDDEEEEIKCDTETVFKTVDKMFTPTQNHENDNLLPVPSINNVSKSSERSHNSSNKSPSKSKEALEIITTLSGILSNENPSEKQKSEGQNLLSSLAEIFISSASTKSRSCILDDSGNSSIESEQVPVSETAEFYQVLDLRKKSTSESNLHQNRSFENDAPLDLSMKSKTFASPKILPPKFNSVMKINKSVGGNCSNSSNDSKNLSDPTKKFKPKKTESLSVRRGPMRAVLPVDNMAKKVTPTRVESKTSLHKLKKTSTPINESNLKPMAQSTPEGLNSSHIISPLARPNKSIASSPTIVKQKLNYSRRSSPIRSDSKPKSNSFTRRVSSDDLKKKQKPEEKPFVRSHSMGEKTGIPSKIIDFKKNRPSKTGSETNVLKENKIRNVNKSFNGRKSGKENLH